MLNKVKSMSMIAMVKLTLAPCNATDATMRWFFTNGVDGLPAPSSVRVCGRIETYHRGGQAPQGYCLVVDSEGAWFLTAGGISGIEHSIDAVIAHGAGLAESGWHTLQVGADAAKTSHSKRSAALSHWSSQPSFEYVMDLTLVPTISKGERQTRRTDAYSSL